jgi:hypothetical protein
MFFPLTYSLKYTAVPYNCQYDRSAEFENNLKTSVESVTFLKNRFDNEKPVSKGTQYRPRHMKTPPLFGRVALLRSYG